MYRLDLRSSDWPAQMALLLWRVVPNELRGQPSDRRVRALATELFERALNEPEQYEHWCEVAELLSGAAARHAIHDMPVAELEALARS
ncbi:MAG: hypothetical protein JNK53_03515, partial [Phycisphaerae bacterium]|nr:hypothetical protein [Phycisphaerae bacterium]